MKSLDTTNIRKGVAISEKTDLTAPDNVSKDDFLADCSGCDSDICMYADDNNDKTDVINSSNLLLTCDIPKT